ncbi:uncharacterized protein MAM_01028 [Metarhizium album ARSEF 1941]|uniref:Protein phosphatase inhibitor n=1 Tax=Metarhizium album (strain ARSEF 1941) TaxID=1081103 RepID=A0A0B2X0F6_METAS|nr:uncharacterized protein MAM_01028 [Metarhizium album ARSEF 1941]KHO02027.1 hypothetical protein MAM_01028 [Metarhizium album ARSEF 1941]
MGERAASVPVFLCPAVVCLRGRPGPGALGGLDRWSGRFYSPGSSATAVDDGPARQLPVTCSGCGAFAQTGEAQHLGFFDLRSKRVRSWLHPQKSEGRGGSAAEDRIVDDALKALDKRQLEALGLSTESMIGDGSVKELERLVTERPPVCDRCHDLMHHSTATGTAKLTMHHPTVESLRETIEESPYKYNHIYHVIDAADFPMSLVPRLNVLLGDVPLRSRNRRSRSSKFHGDRKTDMSFIITRGDLLGPTKEIVDSMMPYLRDVLRDALGRVGGRVRLGNLKCVSARRGWWTKDLKEDIWNRGGAGWMVGKVNVGKSQLFEAVYPKGRMDASKKRDEGQPAPTRTGHDHAHDQQSTPGMDFGELLPPPQPNRNYPSMPVVSSLPGTTASPIRVPFGNGRGELVDLPGLARSDLELFVKEPHRQSLVMKKRVVPEQVVVKYGKSLILGGGLIRITPRTPGLVFLMYNFTPINEHLTITEKAIGFQEQTRESPGVENISLAGVGGEMKHAGTFKLCHDVTKKRAGPLTRKNAVGLQVDRLPFRVVSVDILIEGVGYVEVVAQVRAKEFERWERMQGDMDRAAALEGEDAGSVAAAGGNEPSSQDPFEQMTRNRRDVIRGDGHAVRAREKMAEPDWPAVDVFSPEGRFVGWRRPINGWSNNKPRVLAEHKKTRPRKSMRGAKKRAKLERRRGRRRGEAV